MRREDLKTAGLAAAVVLVDQASKALVVARIPPGERVDVIPGTLTLVHARNSGLAGGTLAGSSTLLIAGIATIALLAVTALVRAYGGRRGMWIALGLILGGGIGNLLDRVRTGAVTDFLRFGNGGPANLGDQAIMLGVVLLIVLILLPERRRRPDREAAAGPASG